MAAAVIEFAITVCSEFMFSSLFLSVIPSLKVKLSHDATCFPSTCSDNDGHPERSSTILPGEPTGQVLFVVFIKVRPSAHASTFKDYLSPVQTIFL